jgi:hypothetical protein
MKTKHIVVAASLVIATACVTALTLLHPLKDNQPATFVSGVYCTTYEDAKTVLGFVNDGNRFGALPLVMSGRCTVLSKPIDVTAENFDGELYELTMPSGKTAYAVTGKVEPREVPKK